MKLVKSDRLSLLSDTELFIALCREQRDEEFYSEFVGRFLPELSKECIQLCKKRKLDQHIGLEIAHETLEKARKYKTFKADEVKAPDSRKGILVYLYRISTNLFNDHHNREKRKNEIHVHKSYFDELFCPPEHETPPEKLVKIREAALQIYSRLNKKEQKVILTDIEYKKHHKYLPDDVNEQLAEVLGVKKATIRKIRERAIIKIKEAIDEINQL